MDTACPIPASNGSCVYRRLVALICIPIAPLLLPLGHPWKVPLGHPWKVPLGHPWKVGHPWKLPLGHPWKVVLQSCIASALVRFKAWLLVNATVHSHITNHKQKSTVTNHCMSKALVKSTKFTPAQPKSSHRSTLTSPTPSHDTIFLTHARGHCPFAPGACTHLQQQKSFPSLQLT